MKKILKFLFQKFGYSIKSNSFVEESLKVLDSKSYEFLKILTYSNCSNFDIAFSTFQNHKSQLLQDIFVLETLNYKKEGFFVEFGVKDGLDRSNTYLLEKSFQWNGIVAEPSRQFHSQLKVNRSCIIDQRCVFTESNLEALFCEVSEGNKNGLSTMEMYLKSDKHYKNRKNSLTYKVQTISLYDMLKENNAPSSIDYLSIDTEGSEYDILKNFPFDDYRFKVITVEHNFTDQRSYIYNLLIKNGYRRVLEEVSKWDDWYILNE